MGRGIQAYLLVQRALDNQHQGPTKTFDRLFKLFGALNQEQHAVFERGLLPGEQGLQSLANEIG
jgi:hypothetical protein